MAQREELDQLYESTKSQFGSDFEIFLKMNTRHIMTPRDCSEQEEESKMDFISDPIFIS